MVLDPEVVLDVMEPEGSYVETCSCELMCPCNLSIDHDATYDFCRATLVFGIRASEFSWAA